MSRTTESSCGGLAPPAERNQTRFGAGSMPLEVLHVALVLFRRCTRLEGAEVAALAGFRVDFAGIEPVFARLQFSDHVKHRLLTRPGRTIGPPALLFRSGYSRCLWPCNAGSPGQCGNEMGSLVQHLFLYALAL